MNPDRTLLLVGANDELVRKAKDLGLGVLLLQHPDKLTDRQRSLADAAHAVDYTDWSVLEPLARRLRAAPGFAACVSMAEAGLEGAGRINDLFGLGGTGHEVVRLLRDKAAMRRHLAATDPDAVGAAPLGDRGDLDAFGARYGHPFIVKPVNATASFGVFRVAGPGDHDRVWDRVRRLEGTRTERGAVPFAVEGFLMEEYLDGPEYSVESFSFRGRHVVVAVTEKFVDPDTFTEVGHVVPARIPADREERVRAEVVRFLDRIGVRDGACHTEVRVGARGPAVVEGHDRMGGDAIHELVRGAYGVDLAALSYTWPLGLADELPDRPEPLGGACTRFLVGPTGTVASVDGVAEALARPEVLTVAVTTRPGARSRPPRDNWDRLGLVAVTGDDADDAVRRAARVAEETLRIAITTGDGGTAFARVADEPVPPAPKVRA